MPNSFLELLQELEDHHLNRNVERRRRLVEHQKVGLDRDGAGNADAGALAAGQLMRKTRQKRSGRPHWLATSFDPLLERLAAQLAQRRSGSAMASKAVKRGLTLSPAS
jgi:hypothetical protein